MVLVQKQLMRYHLILELNLQEITNRLQQNLNKETLPIKNF